MDPDQFLANVGDNEFQFVCPVEGKAEVEELEDGDLLIEGWAAEFDGVDREGENFTEGAFQRGIKSFLDGPASLCYHHKREKCLGKVLELEEVPGRGLRMKARVDGAIREHPEFNTYYNQIKKGTLSALSVGGFFKRSNTPKGPRISDMDFTEISITPVPTHPKPSFAVIAGKALEDHDLKEEEVVYPAELIDVLDKLDRALEGKAEVTEPKGDYDDRQALALIIAFEQLTNNIPEADDTPDKDGDARVDKLIGEVKEALDGYAKQAHALASKLGPLPTVNWEHNVG